MLSKLTGWVKSAPTTKIRILMTVAIWLGTAIWVWTGGIPSGAFLATITVMSGLDAIQHIGKRATAHKPTELAEAARITNGHDSPSDEEVG